MAWRRYAGELRALMVVAEVLAVVVSFGLAGWLRFADPSFVLHRQLAPYDGWVLLGLAAAWVLLLDLQGLYHPRQFLRYKEELVLVFRSWVALGVSFSVFLVLAKLDVSRLFLVYFFLLLLFSTLALRGGLRVFLNYWRSRGYNERYVLVVGAGERGRQFVRRLERHPELGLKVIGYLDDDPRVAGGLNGYALLGQVSSLADVLHHEVVDEIVICLPPAAWEKINEVVATCEMEGKHVRLPVDFLQTRIARGRVDQFDGLPLVSLSCVPDGISSRVLKRAFDLVLSSLVLAVLSPLFLVLTVLIKLDSPGPVFFAQERVGLHGRRFRCYKFRSMVQNAEALLAELAAANEMDGPAFKMKNDPRITRMGRFLRRTSLDELPQFINVFKGEMSVVGPRPPLPHEVERYGPEQRRRLSVKPGITCIWQVEGRNQVSFADWVRMDLEYIDNWSLGLDLKLVWRTCLVMLGRTGW